MVASRVHVRSRVVARVVAVLGGVLLYGCGADADAHQTTDDDVDVVIVLDDIMFVPDRIEVAAGDMIDVRLRNEGGIVHDLVTDEWDSGLVQPGRSADVVLGPFTETTTAWCSVPGHRDAGMELEIVVAAG